MTPEEADHTVPERDVTVTDPPGREELFLKFEDSDKRRVTILRDEDARELYQQLADYFGIGTADYPHAAFHALTGRADDRFAAKREAYGPGKNWRDDPQGWMARQATRKLRAAVHADDREVALDALADALNYTVFEADNLLNPEGDAE